MTINKIPVSFQDVATFNVLIEWGLSDRVTLFQADGDRFYVQLTFNATERLWIMRNVFQITPNASLGVSEANPEIYIVSFYMDRVDDKVDV